jgi:3-methylfumaryl-CoA hydratase
MNSDTIALKDWIGRMTEAEDVVTPRLVDGFRATLSPHLGDSDAVVAPLGIHWCLAPEMVEAAKLNSDGHPARGDFLPPVPLPRRMWAGSDVEFLAPLKAWDRVRRRSVVVDITEKTGKSGPLCFVAVQHEFENGHGLAVRERQTLVYRAAAEASKDQPRAAPAALAPIAEREWQIAVDPVLLFRYSALTFNGHRIHYDAPYTTGVEHYPGLVIHGPLQATILLNLAASVQGAAPRIFSFRGISPATGSQVLRARSVLADNNARELIMAAADGTMTMKASATW